MFNRSAHQGLSATVTAANLGECSTHELLQLAAPHIDQHARLKAGRCDPGTGLAGFVRAGFIEQGLLTMGRDGQAEELPAALVAQFDLLELLDQRIADRPV